MPRVPIETLGDDVRAMFVLAADVAMAASVEPVGEEVVGTSDDGKVLRYEYSGPVDAGDFWCGTWIAVPRLGEPAEPLLDAVVKQVIDEVFTEPLGPRNVELRPVAWAAGDGSYAAHVHHRAAPTEPLGMVLAVRIGSKVWAFWTLGVAFAMPGFATRLAPQLLAVARWQGPWPIRP